MVSTKYFLFILAIVYCSAVFSQEDAPPTIIINNDTIVIEAIPMAEISDKAETVYKEIKSVSTEFSSFQDQKSIDSLFERGKNILLVEIKRIEKSKESMSNRELLDEEKEWKRIRKELDVWKDKFNNRSIIIDEQSKKVDLMLQKWTLTLDEAIKQEVPEQLMERIQTVLKDIKTINKEVKEKQDQIYLNQDNITEFILAVDDILITLEEESAYLMLTYLKMDSPAIWEASDTVSIFQIAKEQTNKYLTESSKNINSFINDSKNKALFHLFFFIFLIVLLYFLKRFLDTVEGEENSELANTKIVISNYFASALILALISMLWIYPIRPFIVNDILQFFIILSSLLLFPRIYGKKIIHLILGIIALLLLNQILILFGGKGLISRILLYAEIIFAGLILYYINKRASYHKSSNKISIWKILYYFTPIFILFLIIAFIGNTFGFVDLSIQLTNSVVHSIFTAIILVLITLLLNSIVTVLFETRFFLKSNIISDNKELMRNRITLFISITIIGFWINSILNSLGLSNQFWNWLAGLFESSWTIGTTTISLGTIISVILIIVITSVVVKLVRMLLEKELFPRIRLPRGVPGAISMVIRYTIVGFGFYFVLSASGIDLGKFGLIAGALGVGIGFGLQNIVFNFIAGLVLAFERPIQIGDVIEVGTLMGTVTSIGVRSSNVKTYDGSEVIVPNGNLISKEVINWTLSDRKKRRVIPVSVAYGSDPHKVLEILLGAANEHVNVLDTPAPWATFEGFGDSSLDFKIRFWAPLDVGMTTMSQVAMSIYDSLEKAGINIPFPQQDIYIKSIEKDYRDVTDQKFNAPGFDKKGPDKTKD